MSFRAFVANQQQELKQKKGFLFLIFFVLSKQISGKYDQCLTQLQVDSYLKHVTL
jgi:hypothetical protein